MAAVGRKAATTASHYSSTSAGNLDNNLDALLDDLQTSIKPGASSSYHTSSSSRHVESSPQHSTTRIIETTPGHSSTRIIEKSTSSRTSPRRSTSPLRSISPSQARNVTVEKYVSSGPIGTASGIPGLEMLDKELADVQPGQSKTVAYKQVSYHYDKQQEGSNLEPWVKTEKISKNDASIVDDFCERTFEKSSSSRVARDSPDFAKSGKEIIYKADVSTKTIPVPQPTTTETRSTERDFKYVKETSYRTEPSPISPRKNIKTVRTDETEELTNVEYIPASTPIPAPGPNTKVTKTVTTYSYQLPPTTTTTTRDTEKSLSYHVEEQRSGVREYVPPPSPASSRVHREEKVYVDRRIYRAPSPPPPVTTSTLSRNERYIQQSSSIPVGHDYTDHSVSRNERVIYQTESQPPPVQPSTERTTVKQYEEHYSSRPPHRPYYPTESAHHSSTTVYKYDEQSLLPKPFPVSERPASPPQQTPRRVDELMASFSDSEEHHEFHEKSDKNSKKVIEHHIKKEVEFIPHSAPMVQSRNFAGPPVYYPPGAVEFSKKEESLMGGSKASGAWAKERAAYEYGSSSKSEEKSKTKKAVVPVCLPLCCALPCSIL